MEGENIRLKKDRDMGSGECHANSVEVIIGRLYRAYIFGVNFLRILRYHSTIVQSFVLSGEESTLAAPL